MKRTPLAAQLLIVTALALAALWAGPATDARMPQIDAVEGVGITVSNLDRAVAFYTNVLSFELVSMFEVGGDAHARLVGVPGARARTARLRLGEEIVELTEYSARRAGPSLPTRGATTAGSSTSRSS